MNHTEKKQRVPASLFWGFVLCLALGGLMQYSALGDRLEAALLDAQIRVLRAHFPAPAQKDVAVVGIDESDLAYFNEPVALWHRHLADFLRVMGQAHAEAVGLDIALPDRSYNDIVPGLDEALMGGILAAKKQQPLVLAITVDSSGKPRTLLPRFQLVAGDGGTAYALFPRDADHAVRRFDERLADNGTRVSTLAGQMARKIGLQPVSGLIDYTRGSAFSYVPLHTVLEWARTKDPNLAQFSGRPVLLGSVLPMEDRVLQPVNLADWEENGNLAPGVLIHAQTLRSIMGNGLVQPAPQWMAPLMVLTMSLLWFARLGKASALAAFIAIALGMFAGDLWLFRQGGHVPLGGVVPAAFFALIGRAALDASYQLKERRLLKRSFAGSVSPVVMREILAGKLAPELGGERRHVCILFADIRDFTTRSEAMPPEAAIALLNRYFQRVVEVIHAEGGAVSSFIGDGIMAIFGAPNPMQNPSRAAFAAAQAMQREVARLNLQLAEEGLGPIRIGIGLHAGEGVVGHVGSSARHDYTAIGDVTNVASRLEGVTKETGHGVICSRAVAMELGETEGLAPLGAHPIKGHTAVEVYGWGKLINDEQ
jgi:adenylate cyclase